MIKRTLAILIGISTIFLGKIHAGEPGPKNSKILNATCERCGLDFQDYIEILDEIKKHADAINGGALEPKVRSKMPEHTWWKGPFDSAEKEVINKAAKKYCAHMYLDIGQKVIQEKCAAKGLNVPSFEDNSAEFDVSALQPIFARIGILIPDVISYNREKSFEQQLLEASRDCLTTMLPGITDQHCGVFEEISILLQKGLEDGGLIPENFAAIAQELPESKFESFMNQILARYRDTRRSFAKLNVTIEDQIERLFNQGEVYAIIAQIVEQNPKMFLKDKLICMEIPQHAFWMNISYLLFLGFGSQIFNDAFDPESFNIDFTEYMGEMVMNLKNPESDKNIREFIVESRALPKELEKMMFKAIKYLVYNEMKPMILQDLQIYILQVMAATLGLPIDQSRFEGFSQFNLLKTAECFECIGLTGCPDTMHYSHEKSLPRQLHEITREGME